VERSESWRTEEGFLKIALSGQWVMGNGKVVFFWEDNWVGFGDLKSRFPRLFSLSVVKDDKLF